MINYIYENNNSKNKKTGDCIIRAISKASGLSWDEIYKTLCDIGFKYKEMPNDKKVFERYLKSVGFEKIKMPYKDNKKRYTVGEYDYDKDKKYIVIVAKHATAVINREMYDTWDCRMKFICNLWIK